MKICKICGREFNNSGGLGTHIMWHDNKKDFSGKNNPHYGKKGGNQYTAGIDFFLSDESRKKLAKGGKNQEWTKERRDKHSKSMRKAIEENPKSYSASNVCGRTKLLDYNGFLLNGKWELDVAKWLDKQNIEWTNIIKKGFEYRWEGKNRLYFPDFYLTKEDFYIEVKGYQRDQDLAKWESLPNLIIFKKNEIEKIRNNTLGPVAQMVSSGRLII